MPEAALGGNADVFQRQADVPLLMTGLGGRAVVLGKAQTGLQLAMTSLSRRWLPLKLKGWNRPITAIQGRWRERLLSDRKTVVQL